MTTSLPGVIRDDHDDPDKPGAVAAGEQALRDLLPGLLTGDPAAGRELYERYQPKMHAYFARRGIDRGRVDDCVSEVITRALEAFRKGQVPDSPERWLWGIARNVLVSEEGLDDRSRGHRSLDALIEKPAERPGAAYDTVGIRQALYDVGAVIETLPPRERELMAAFLALSRAEGDKAKASRLVAALGRGWTLKDFTASCIAPGRQ